MMLIIPKNESKIMKEVEDAIKSMTYKIAAENGIDYRFVYDSKCIDEGIAKIANAMARICTMVKKDKAIVMLEKKKKEFEIIEDGENGK